MVSRTDYTCVFGFSKSAKGGTVDPDSGLPEAITEGVDGKGNIDVNAEVSSLSGEHITDWKSATTTGTDIWTLFNKGEAGQGDELNHPGIYYDTYN